jgi:hypothetical protein
VQNIVPDLYRPSSAVLVSGWIFTLVSTVKLALVGCRVRWLSVSW